MVELVGHVNVLGVWEVHCIVALALLEAKLLTGDFIVAMAPA